MPRFMRSNYAAGPRQRYNVYIPRERALALARVVVWHFCEWELTQFPAMINKDVNHNYHRYTDRSRPRTRTMTAITMGESNIHHINKLVDDRPAQCNNNVVYHGRLVHSSLPGSD